MYVSAKRVCVPQPGSVDTKSWLQAGTDSIPLLQGALLSTAHEAETVAGALADGAICCTAACTLLHALRHTVAFTLTPPALQLTRSLVCSLIFSVCSFIHSFIHSLVRSFIDPFIHSLTCSFLCGFMHAVMHLLIHAHHKCVWQEADFETGMAGLCLALTALSFYTWVHSQLRPLRHPIPGSSLRHPQLPSPNFAQCQHDVSCLLSLTTPNA